MAHSRKKDIKIGKSFIRESHTSSKTTMSFKTTHLFQTVFPPCCPCVCGCSRGAHPWRNIQLSLDFSRVFGSTEYHHLQHQRTRLNFHLFRYKTKCDWKRWATFSLKLYIRGRRRCFVFVFSSLCCQKCLNFLLRQATKQVHFVSVKAEYAPIT